LTVSATSTASTFLGGLNVGTTTSVSNALLTIGSSSNIMAVLNNGNVGIGTSSPASLLTVGANGGFQVNNTGNATTTALSITGLGSSGNPCLVIGANGAVSTSTCGGTATPVGSDQQVQFNNGGSLGANSYFTFTSSTGVLGITSSTGAVVIGTSTNAANALLTVATSSNILTVLQNGNVGIGTTTPAVPFSVRSNLAGNGGDTMHLENDNATGYSDFSTYGSDGVKKLSIGYANPSASAFTNSAYILTQTNIPLLMGASGSIAMAISANGNVGIGTTTPSAALQIGLDASSTANSALFTVGSTTPVLQLGESPLASPSANGTYLAANAPSGFSGNFINFQTGGSNEFTVDNGGHVVAGNSGYPGTFQAGSGAALAYAGISMNAGNQTLNFSGWTYSSTGYSLNFNNQGNASWSSGEGGLITLPSNSGFNPSSGNGIYDMMNMGLTINQTGSANGITRGLYLNPALTGTYDYRNLEVAAATTSLSNANPAATLYNVLLNPITYTTASTTAYTILTASTLDISGAPISTTGTLSITNSYGLRIESNNVTASTTNAYGLAVAAPTGATNGYAAIFTGGNVGIGTTTPSELLTLNAKSGATAQILGMNNDFGGTTGSGYFLSTGAASGNTYTALQALNAGGTAGGMLALNPSGGNVGIGTSSPASLLTVGANGGFQVNGTGNATTTALSITGLGSSGNPCLVIGTNGAVSTSTCGGGGSISTSSAITAGFLPYWWNTAGGLTGTSTLFFSTSTGSLVLGSTTAVTNAVFTVATSSNILTVLNNGNVGIGATTSVPAVLTVTSNNTSSVLVQDTSGNSVFAVDSSQSGGNTGIDITAGGTQGSNNLLNFYSSSSIGIAGVTANGRIFIATSTPWSATTTLTVCSISNCSLPGTSSSTNAVAVFASVDGLTTGASIIAKGTITGGLSDVGEFVPIVGSDTDYTAGDLLSVASTSDAGVITGGSASSTVALQKSSTSYDPNLMGVVTVTAGLIAGGGGPGHSDTVMTLAGRVPVKVSDMNGAIKVGDYLTASDIPGVAMRATQPGRVIGIALEAYSSTSTDIATSALRAVGLDAIGITSSTPSSTVNGIQSSTVASYSTSAASSTYGFIMVYVNPGWSLGSLTDEGDIASSSWAQASSSATSSVSQSTGVLDQFTLYIKYALQKLGLAISNGIATVTQLFAQKVTTQQLCVGSTCIDQAQLEQLLQMASSSGGQPATSSQQPVNSNSTTPTNTPPPAPANISAGSALSISFTSPATGATVSGTVPLEVNITTAPSTTVSTVDYEVDGADLGKGLWTNNPEYSYSWDTTPSTSSGQAAYPNGVHQLSAIVTDSTGATSTAAMSVDVENGGAAAQTTSSTSPTASSTPPAATSTPPAQSSTSSTASSTPVSVASSTPGVATTTVASSSASSTGL
ncbi:MAG: hypothetical protein KGJ13_02995, partial [Patescibacteria group bacterium]|nr:hypothetical protein [Patescibacteria group bacterium]